MERGNAGFRGTVMSRKNWSNLFLFFAAVSLMLGVLPSNPLPMLAWIALPIWLALGTISRRRMV